MRHLEFDAGRAALREGPDPEPPPGCDRRVLQGLGGGMVMPAGMTILTKAAGRSGSAG